MAFSILKWQREVIDRCLELRPGNHSAIAALVPALVRHARKDGSQMSASRATLAREAGLHHSTVKRAIEWMKSENLVELARNQTTRRAKEYKLRTRIGDSLEGSDRASATENGANGLNGLERAQLEGRQTEFRHWAEERNKTRAGGPGLLRTILNEDYDDFLAEQTKRKIATAVMTCGRCDLRGMVWIDDSTQAKCSHPGVAS
jgi:DNA-binding MarR family transcriptional regulator